MPSYIKSGADLRADLRVRFYKAAFLLMTVLTMTGCAAAPIAPSSSASVSRPACYWPQSWSAGCHEIAEWSPRE
jgi:hypothetical protein